MSKKVVIAKTENIDLEKTQSTSSIEEYEIDWAKFVLCQEKNNAHLVCPVNYETFLQDINRYYRSGRCLYQLHSSLVGDIAKSIWCKMA